MILRDSLHILLNLHEIERLLQKIESLSPEQKLPTELAERDKK
jgi:hypothetical protein